MPDRTLSEIVEDLKRDLNNEAECKVLLQELQEWKRKHQRESSSISKARSPMQLRPGLPVTLSQNKGKKGPLKSPEIEMDFDSLTKVSSEVEGDISNINREIKLSCLELEKSLQPQIDEISIFLQHWQEQIQVLEKLKSKLRSAPEDEVLPKEIEALSKTLQEGSERYKSIIQELLQESQKVTTSLTEKANTLTKDLPPRLKVLVQAELEATIKNPLLSTMIPKLNFLDQQLETYSFAYISQKGSETKGTLLDIAAFDDLKELSKIPNINETVKRQIDEFIVSGKPAFWPEYFEQGTDVNLDSLKSGTKKSYMDKEVVQPFKRVERLSDKGKKELVQEWINKISVLTTGTDEQLYQSLRSALRLSLNEQPLNLEKIQGQDQKSGNPVPFFKLKDPNTPEAGEAIDSEDAFMRASLAAHYLRETYSSTILAQFDALHEKIGLLQDPTLPEQLKTEAQQAIDRTVTQFKAALFKQRGRVVPDENLLDVFKVMLAPRKVSAKEESIPGITPLLAELNIQFYDPKISELISSAKRDRQAFIIELQSLMAEYTALEKRAPKASMAELESISQRKAELEKLIDDTTMAIDAIAKQVFKSLPKKLKIEPQKSVVELDKKPEFRGIKTTLFVKSQEREELNKKIIELQAEKAKLEKDLQEIPVYEADTVIEELTQVSDKLEKLKLESSKPFTIEPQHRPLTTLSNKYQADIQGYYLNSAFASPSIKATEKQKSEADTESVRDYRGLYYQIEKSKPPVAIETLYKGHVDSPEELIKELAKIIMQGTNDVPAIAKPEDWAKLQIDLDFLSWEEKKSLAAFLTPASFKLNPSNFIELQSNISKVLIGAMSSKVEMKDLLEIAAGIKFRRPGKNLAATADVKEAFNAKPDEYFSTKDLITTVQEIDLNSRMIENAKMATKSQDIPEALHDPFLAALPGDIKTPILKKMIFEKVPLDNFDVEMLKNSEYKMLFSSMLEFLLKEHISKPSANKADRPEFLKKPFAVDNEIAQNLSTKFITYFEAQGSSKNQALTNLIDYYFDCIRDRKIDKVQLIGFTDQSLDREDVAQTCAKKLFPVSQLIEHVSLEHPEVIAQTIAKLQEMNQEASEKVLTQNNIIQHLTSASQRAIVTSLLRSGDAKAKQFLKDSFPEAKVKFAKNLKLSQGVLSAMALAPFITGEIARNAEKHFNLKGTTLDRFNDLIERHIVANTEKTNNLSGKRIIENAFLNPEYLAKLVEMLKESDSSATLNIDLQEFDDFQEELSKRLSIYLETNKEKGIAQIYERLNFDQKEKEAIGREVAEIEEEFLKNINLDLAKFLVANASTEDLSQFLDSLSDDQKHQFVLDNMGPKPLLMQLPPNDLMLLVNNHYNEVAASIDPANAIKRRDIYLSENKEKQNRQKRLEEASAKAKESIEKQKIELANKRLAEDRARLLMSTSINLDQDILRELDQLGFNKADSDTVKLLRDIRTLRTSLNTIALLDVPSQIQEMNSQIFPGLKNLQIEITKLLALIEENINVEQRQIDQGVMTIVTKELAEANHLFLSKGQELGSVAIHISGLQEANAELRSNIEQAKGDSSLQIMQLRRELEDAKQQLEKEKQRSSSFTTTAFPMSSSSLMGSNIQEETRKRLEIEAQVKEAQLQEETRKRLETEAQLKEAQEMLSKKTGVGPPQGPIDALQQNKPIVDALEAFYNQEEYEHPGVHRSPDKREVIEWLKSAYRGKYTQYVPQVDAALSEFNRKHKI